MKMLLNFDDRLMLYFSVILLQVEVFWVAKDCAAKVVFQDKDGESVLLSTTFSTSEPASLSDDNNCAK